MFCDSTGALSVIHNPVLADFGRHIDVILHHLRERQDAGYVNFEYIPSNENVADALTKALPRPAFEQHRESMRLSVASQ
jgi:hypothetical protein